MIILMANHNLESSPTITMCLLRWHAKLNNWHAFGTFARLLARWHVKMRIWHAFGTLARRPHWHAWHVWQAI